MTTLEIIAQAISIAAMAFNIISYQSKSKFGILFLQFFGSLLFAISFFMIGSVVSACLNLIGVFRAAVYANRDRFHSDHILWLFGFSLLFIASYVLNFTVLGGEPTFTNLTVQLLPVIAMILTTVSFRLTGARAIRRLSLVSSPLWLFHNIVVFSIGAILCEVISLISVIVAMVRLDFGHKAEEAPENDPSAPDKDSTL